MIISSNDISFHPTRFIHIILFHVPIGRRRNEDENDREPLVALVPCDAIILRGEVSLQLLILRVIDIEIS